MLKTDELANATLEQAAEWFAVLRDGQACDSDRAAWQQWLLAADENRVAWHYVQQISRRFEPLQQTADPRRTAGTLQTAHARLKQRRQVLAGMGAFAAAGLLGWWNTRLPNALTALAAHYRTATGEQRQLRLADGSNAWLNTDSALDVDFVHSLRRLTLHTGEVFIDTASDVRRAFVVETRHGSLRALGTRFDVRLVDEETRLAVYDGAVEIRTRHGASHIVEAGEQSSFTDLHVTPPIAADNAREAWTRGLLVAQDIALRELVAELRRYRHGHIGVSDAIAELRVYGSFPLHDTDQALAMLTTALPVEIRKPLPWWISIEPRRG